MTNDDETHWRALETAWRAVKRDVFYEVETFAGLHSDDDGRYKRLLANWKRLTALDPSIAAWWRTASPRSPCCLLNLEGTA
jgi:hypothetical protein